MTDVVSIQEASRPLICTSSSDVMFALVLFKLYDYKRVIKTILSFLAIFNNKFVKTSAGLANKQNKHVLVAPTSKGAPDCLSKSIHIWDIVSKVLNSFKYHTNLLAPSVVAKFAFLDKIKLV